MTFTQPHTSHRNLVLGLGDTGYAAARWLVARGEAVMVADSRLQPPNLAALRNACPDVEVVCGRFHDHLLDGITRLVLSPGLSQQEPLVQQARQLGIPVVGDVELFALELQQIGYRGKLVAITGTNGKSTVTSMVGRMAEAAGFRTLVAGNIGLPVLEAALDSAALAAYDYIVLELSSFQLETTATLQPTAATVLNVTEDHLDRYPGLAEYAAAKERIFAAQTVQVLNRDDAWSLGMARAGAIVTSFGLDAPAAGNWGIRAEQLVHGERSLLPLAELPLAGRHNAANALAALALGDACGLPEPAMLTALRQFKALPHRVEPVATVGGVTFLDDSKGTNVGSTVAALRGLDNVIWIAGGDGKGQDFSPLAAAVQGRVRAAILLGRDGPAIAEVLGLADFPVEQVASMDDAVHSAYRRARPGDVVLLSPACASLDMFRNYKHRAEVFVAAVHRLEARP